MRIVLRILTATLLAAGFLVGMTDHAGAASSGCNNANTGFFDGDYTTLLINDVFTAGDQVQIALTAPATTPATAYAVLANDAGGGVTNFSGPLPGTVTYIVPVSGLTKFSITATGGAVRIHITCTAVGVCFGGDVPPGYKVKNGTSGNDVMLSLSGNTVFFAGDGNDTVFAGSGNDIICGEGGNDTLNGGPGNDQIFGGTGNDKYDGGSGTDQGNDPDCASQRSSIEGFVCG